MSDKKIFLIDLYNKSSIPVNERLVIGRVKGDLTFPEDLLISGSHCVITTKNENIYIMDLKSKNYTKINGVVIKANLRVPLKIGDNIELGEQRFLVADEEYGDEYLSKILNAKSEEEFIRPKQVSSELEMEIERSENKQIMASVFAPEVQKITDEMKVLNEEIYVIEQQIFNLDQETKKLNDSLKEEELKFEKHLQAVTASITSEEANQNLKEMGDIFKITISIQKRSIAQANQKIKGLLLKETHKLNKTIKDLEEKATSKKMPT